MVACDRVSGLRYIGGIFFWQFWTKFGAKYWKYAPCQIESRGKLKTSLNQKWTLKSLTDWWQGGEINQSWRQDLPINSPICSLVATPAVAEVMRLQVCDTANINYHQGSLICTFLQKGHAEAQRLHCLLPFLGSLTLSLSLYLSDFVSWRCWENSRQHHLHLKRAVLKTWSLISFCLFTYAVQDWRWSEPRSMVTNNWVTHHQTLPHPPHHPPLYSSSISACLVISADECRWCHPTIPLMTMSVRLIDVNGGT